jgi:poly-gamma-glutamate capsule biosynthesis protein CapA/YwtB (metallophosphatase superfamily)
LSTATIVFALLFPPTFAWVIHRVRREPRERPWWIAAGVVAAVTGVLAAVNESDPLFGALWAAGGFADIVLLVAFVELFRWRLGTLALPLAAIVLCVPAPTGALAGEAVTISWVGDMSFSRKHGLPAKPDSVFAPVRASLAADLVTGNLEGTLGRGGPSKCGGGGANCFAFQAPASYAGVFGRAGFEMLNMANNHSRDFGTSGLRQTERALSDAGIARTGLRGRVRVMEANGIRVAFLGFAPYAWAGPLLDIPQARGEVKAARAAALRAATRGHLRAAAARRRRAAGEVASAAEHADVVIVFIHAGAEGSGATHVPHGRETAFGENRGETRRFSRTMIDAGADAVLGSGPHVLRGIQCHRGRPIAYSLGNFVGYRTLSTSGVLALSGVLRVRIGADGRFLGGRLVPVRLQGPGVPRIDSEGRSIDLVRRLSRQDFGKGRCPMAADGKFRAP